MRVKRSELQKPTLPEEVVPVPELGGDVLVRGLGLAARLSLQEDFKAATPFGHMTPLLAACVLADDDKPLYTACEWEAWGAENSVAVLKLWDIAWRLSDLDGKEAAKKLKAPTSD